MNQRTTVARRHVIAGLGMTALTACSPAWPWREEAERPAEGGVGGTGIVGVLTARDRLSINGLVLAASPDIAVTDAFGSRRLESLAAGQALTIEAAGETARSLTAQSIRVTHPVVATIESVTGNRFQILGIDVIVEPGAILADLQSKPFTLASEQRVAVSGLWRGDQVIASRVDLVDRSSGPDAVAGEVKPGVEEGTLRIGSLPLNFPAGAPRPAVGSYATAVGRHNGTALLAENVDEGRFRGTAGPLQRLSIEGYLEPMPSAPGYAVSGLGHSFDQAAQLAALEDGRALFVGVYDGAFRVEHGLALAEDRTTRGRQLASVQNPFAPEGAFSTR